MTPCTRLLSHAQPLEAKRATTTHNYSETTFTNFSDRLFDIDANTTNAPEDFYIAISEAAEAARAIHIAELDAVHSLYIFEFYNFVKIGGPNIPYACIE